MEERIREWLDKKEDKSQEEYILLAKLACGIKLEMIQEYCPDLIPVIRKALWAIAKG